MMMYTCRRQHSFVCTRSKLLIKSQSKYHKNACLHLFMQNAYKALFSLPKTNYGLLCYTAKHFFYVAGRHTFKKYIPYILHSRVIPSDWNGGYLGKQLYNWREVKNFNVINEQFQFLKGKKCGCACREASFVMPCMISDRNRFGSSKQRHSFYWKSVKRTARNTFFILSGGSQ